MSLTRRLVLALMVCGVMAAAPAVASATTTYATISDPCWLREYPPDTTCENGWVGSLGVGYTNLGESVSFFNAAFNVPTGAEVTEATLRYYSPYDMYDQVYLGEASDLDWGTSTWQTYDTANINVFTDFTPGAAGFGKEVDVTAAVQAFLANSQTSALFGLYADDPTEGTFLDDLELEIEYEL